MLGVIVLLECKSLPHSKVFYTPKQVLKDLPIFGSIHCSLIPYKSPSACQGKASPLHDAATIMLHGRDGVRWVMSCARFLPDVVLCIQTKEFNCRLDRPQRLLPRALSLSCAFLQTPGMLSCNFLQEWLLSGHSPISRDLWSAAKTVVLPEGSPISANKFCSSIRVVSGFLLTSLTKPFLAQLLSLVGRPALGRVCVVLSFIFSPFPNDGAHCALGNFKHPRNCFMAFPRSMPPHNAISTDSSLDFMVEFLLWHALPTVEPCIERCVSF